MHLVELEQHCVSQLAFGGFLSASGCQWSTSLHADWMFRAAERNHYHVIRVCAARGLAVWMFRALTSAQVLWLDFRNVLALLLVPSVADLQSFHLYSHPRGTIYNGFFLRIL